MLAAASDGDGDDASASEDHGAPDSDSDDEDDEPDDAAEGSGGRNKAACEVRRVGDKKWRRFASRVDAADAFPGLIASHVRKLIMDKPSSLAPQRIRDQYEARDAADASDSESEADADDVEEVAPTPALAPAVNVDFAAAPPAEDQPCEVRRVGDADWRRFASRADAARALGVSGLDAAEIGKLIHDSPAMPRHARPARAVRERFEARAACAAGPFEVVPRDEDECVLCQQSTLEADDSPMQNVLICDACDGDVHLACSGLSAMPGDDEPFTCSACAVVAPPAKRARVAAPAPAKANADCAVDALLGPPPAAAGPPPAAPIPNDGSFLETMKRPERDKKELEKMKRRLAAAPASPAVPAVFAPPPALEELLSVPFQDAVAML